MLPLHHRDRSGDPTPASETSFSRRATVARKESAPFAERRTSVFPRGPAQHALACVELPLQGTRLDTGTRIRFAWFFTEWFARLGPLPHRAKAIGYAINRGTDAVTQAAPKGGHTANALDFQLDHSVDMDQRHGQSRIQLRWTAPDNCPR